MNKTPTSLFDFHIPEQLIALYPEKERDKCRLLVIEKDKRKISETMFIDIKNYLKEGDLLVFNNTKVDNSRFFAINPETNRKHEVVIISYENDGLYRAITNRFKRIKKERLYLENNRNLYIDIIEKIPPYYIIIKLSSPEILDYSELPLPPYILKKRKYEKDLDEKYYQTVYGKYSGSKASPTAGLHFTENLLKELKNIGVETANVQLFVSLGTFEPIKTEFIEDHKIHEEEYNIFEEEAEKINRAISEKRRIIAVGTTSMRVLESSFKDGKIIAGKEKTSLYITPGYKFKVTDKIITNFHTPRSTLLVLVSSILGLQFTKEVYNYAIEKRFRFYSYGDASLII